MAESDVVAHNSPILTEEMIDAAMNTNFKNISKDSDEEEKRNNSSEDSYSSDYDYQVETIDSDSPIVRKELLSLEKGSVSDGQTNKESELDTTASTLGTKTDDCGPKASSTTDNTLMSTSLPEQKNEANEKVTLKLKPIKNLLKDNVVNAVQSYGKDSEVKVFTRVNGKVELIQNSPIRSPKKKPAQNVKRVPSEKLKGDCSLNDPKNCLSGHSSSEEVKNNKSKTTKRNSNNSRNVRKNVQVIKLNKNIVNSNEGNKRVYKKNQVNNNLLEVRENCLKPTRVYAAVKNKNLSAVSSKPVLPPIMINNHATNSKDINLSIDEPHVIGSSDSSDEDGVAQNVVSKEKPQVVQLSAPSTSGVNVVQTSNDGSATICNSNSLIATRRPILPKICYRYHTNDKVLRADVLPNTTVISVKNQNNTASSNSSNGAVNVFKLPDGSTAKNVILMTPEKIALQQPPTLSTQTVQVATTKSKYLRNVINTIVRPSSKLTINGPKTNSVSLLRNASITSNCMSTSKNWEKVERPCVPVDENSIAKELREKNLVSQIMERVLPVYNPPEEATEIFPCLDCGDRYAVEASLQRHRQRKSILIVYWCRICSSCLNMYNRCAFLGHLRFHNQLFKNIDMSCLSIEPLPNKLLGLTLDVELITTRDASSFVVTNNVPDATATISSSVSTTTSSAIESNTNSTDNSTIVLNTIDNSNITSRGRTDVATVQTSASSEAPAMEVVENSSSQTSSNVQTNSQPDVIPMDTDEIATQSNENNEEKTIVININRDFSVSSKIDTPVLKEPFKNVEKDSADITDKADKSEIKAVQAKVRPKRVCPECGILLTAKASLRKHLQNFNKPLKDSLKCPECNLILQSPCSLVMHRRIHKRLQPFRCPDCALEFNHFERFMMHLKFTCCHSTKVVRYVCSLCSSMQVSAELLEQHLMTRHVRSIFKCGVCPVAFVNAKGAEKHKERDHPDASVPTQSYQQCKLCPDKLIPKKRFLYHMKGHLNDEKLRIYAYQCPTCKYTFFHRTELIYHRMKCESKSGIINTMCDDDSLKTVNGDNCAPTDRVVDEQEIDFPSKKSTVVNDDESSLCTEEEKDPLSLEDFQAEVIQEPSVQTCVVCKTEQVLILPGKNQSSQSLCCKKCVSPCGTLPYQKNKLAAAKQKRYLCNICRSDYMSLKSIFIHFKHNHKELEGQNIDQWLTTEITIPVKKSSTFTTAETIREKYKVKRSYSAVANSDKVPNECKTEIENKSDGSPEKKKPKRVIKSKQKGSEEKSFESGQLISVSDSQSKFSCAKCDFVSTNKDELYKHVVCHRTDPNALQCLECGECFIVLPSLEKHLIINHGIVNVEKYVIDQKICKTSQIDSSDDNEPNKCKVCRESFKSKFALDKHFRSHGMAFLFKK